MSPRHLLAIASEHNKKHRGMFPMLCRVSFYVIAAGLSVLAASVYASGSPTVILSLFLLSSVTFEMLSHMEHRGVRWWAYVFCVVALSFSGLFLVREAMQLHAAEPVQHVINR